MTPSSLAPASYYPAPGATILNTQSNNNNSHSTGRLGHYTVGAGNADLSESQRIINQVVQQIVANHPPAPVPASSGIPSAPPPKWIDALLHAEKTGVSPLNRAIIEGDFEMAQLLMENGARANATIEHTINHSDTAVLPLFNPANVEANQQRRNFTVIEFILHRAGTAPRGEISYLGANALTLAILCKVSGAFFCNLCAHAKKQDKSILEKQDAAGRTPLGVAVANNDIDHVRGLLLAGAKPDTKTHDQKTPLLLAIANGNTQLMVILLKAGASSSDKQGKNTALKLCFDKRKYADFSAYQAVSNQCRIEVFKFFCKKINPILENGTEADLLDFLQAAAPVMTTQRLAKLAAKAAKIPGALCKTMILIESIQGALTPKQLLALRDAAMLSGDQAIYDYAIQLDTHLVKLINNSSKPGAKKQVVLNAELGRALLARSKHWVNELLKHGAVFVEPTEMDNTYPLLSQLADLGDEKLLEKYSSKTNNFARPDENSFTFFVQTQTGAGLANALSVHLTSLKKTPSILLESLCFHAIKLRSVESMKFLISAGASLNLHEIYTWGGFYSRSNPLIKLAMRQHDIPMIRCLIEGGARPTSVDLDDSTDFDPSNEIYNLLKPPSSRN